MNFAKVTEVEKFEREREREAGNKRGTLCNVHTEKKRT